jgi:hypothetical protein
VKVAPWLHGGSLQAPILPSWTPSTDVRLHASTGYHRLRIGRRCENGAELHTGRLLRRRRRGPR